MRRSITPSGRSSPARSKATIHTTNYAGVRARALRVAQRLDARRHPARRPGRHARLEYLAPSRGLVRDHGHRRGLPHGQPAPLSRADRLDRQSRRRPYDARRSDLRAAAGEARRRAAKRIERYVVLTDAAHMPADLAQERGRPTRNGSPRSTAISPGGRSTRTRPPACATRRAPPATRRASSTRIARTSCTP